MSLLASVNCMPYPELDCAALLYLPHVFRKEGHLFIQNVYKALRSLPTTLRSQGMFLVTPVVTVSCFILYSTVDAFPNIQTNTPTFCSLSLSCVIFD